ncbi:hypothetical protein PHLGIDRAFT_65051 [Phlebiopsis gigantea 11061_1 CR5-6]|uniref:DDE Tnp4 domain-containing protein n=1 Tax=Phlebiopsis gigantea (strain 11061_1 CR5-6) TaxID=745531 RepID=A0A0C3SER2_PHLG1|nr:hypothetical protein PHLGIDRAFT_65051 [Phlebiopsis gigantea 11061_1 CR5-6]
MSQRYLDDCSIDEEQDDDERRLALLALCIVVGAEQARLLRNARRRRTYLTRPELLPNPRSDTPWQALYSSHNDRAFITTMGVDNETFHYLLESGFSFAWDTTAIPRTDTDTHGQPRIGGRSLDAAGALGLYLHYISSTMTDTGLGEVFAIIPSTISRYIQFSRALLLATLRNLPEGAVRYPRDFGDGRNEFDAHSELVQERHPRLVGAIGTMDGLNLPLGASSDSNLENATYSGWLHSHCCSCVFAFSPKGTIIIAHTNAPGSWHDSRIARPIYQKLDRETPEGYYLVADTAFPRGVIGSPTKIRAPIKVNTPLPQDEHERQELLHFNNELISYRQSAEWGMRALQGSFGRLRLPLDINDSSARADLLETCVRMNNVRALRVGIHQIRNVYAPIWQNGEDERLWNGFERLLFPEIQRGDRIARFYFDA